MSHFGGLLIQGIRSFGPNEDDVGKIVFFKPLTLIMGQNGCGKTTIIESLKYACTGEMPPGTNRGQSFVHDPSMAGETTVKGQVKLMFHNVRGQKMVAQRIIEASQKAKQITVKTLDSTLTRMETDEAPVSVNKKCADMDLELFASLGVTKPILNHVIFCHQEDSSWPLDEGKKLKERFDAIFDATEYLNCIKKIKEHIKQLREKEIEKKGDAATAQKDHSEAERLKQEIREEEERLSASEKRVNASKDELKQVRTRLREVQKMEDEAGEVEAERTRNQTLMEEAKRACSNLETTLSRPGCMPVADDVDQEQLDAMLQELTSGADQRRRDVQRDQSELSTGEQRLQQLKDSENRLNVQLGKLEADEERMRQCRRDRDALARELSSKYGRTEQFSSTSPDDELSERDVRTVVSFLQDRVRDADKKLREAADNSSNRAQAAQAQVDAVRCRKTKLESDRDHRRQQVRSNESEIVEKRRLLAEARGSASKIEQLDSELAVVESRISSLDKQLDVDATSEEIASDEHTAMRLEKDLRRLQADKDALQSCLTLKKELNIHEETLQKRQAEIDQLMADNKANFVTVELADVARVQLSHTLKSRCTQLMVTTNKKEAEMKRIQKQLIAREVAERQAREQVATLEREMSAEQADLQTTLQSADLEVELADTDMKAQELEKLHGQLTAMRHLYGRYTEKLQAEAPCPLCHRQFESRTESEKLVDELQRLMEGLPREILEAEEKKRRNKERHEDLLTLRPKQERVVRLRDNDLPAARTRLQQARAELSQVTSDQTALQRELTEHERRRRCAEDLRTDVSRIDERDQEVHRLQAECDRVKAQMPSATVVSEGRTLQQVDAELLEQRRRLDQLRVKVRQSEQRLRQHRELLRKAADERHSLKTGRLALERLQSEQQALETRCVELKELNQRLTMEIEAVERDVVVAASELQVETDRREQALTAGREAEETARRNTESVQTDLRQLSTAQETVTAHQRRDSSQSLLGVRQKLRVLTDELTDGQAQVTRLRKAIDDRLEALRSQESRQRDLQDHKQLRLRRADVARLDEKVQAAARRLCDYDVQGIRTNRRNIEARYNKLSQVIFGEEGAQERMRGVLTARTDKLNGAQFNDAESVFRLCNIEYACIRLASKDLTQYAKALDDALIGFHSERMEHINNIIRELWRDCYCGNDIDHIEIRTDCSAGNAKRTTYNYRVVMVKNEVEMDMRGRCSAGQKVLACLIIRMALAETFGISCGMLTLDEPTTNLDQENIVKLAEALSEIVSKRSAQSNFQLVIITHDEAFLNILSRSEHLNKYYVVSRNQRGLSKITRKVNR